MLLAFVDASPSWRFCWSTSATIPLLSSMLLLAMLCLRVLQLYLRFGLSSSDIWCYCSCLVLCSKYLATCALFVGCFVIIGMGGCFDTNVAPVLRILCRVVSGGCFAAMLLVDLVRVDTLPPLSSLLGGYFVTAASPPLLQPPCCVFSLVDQVG